MRALQVVILITKIQFAVHEQEIPQYYQFLSMIEVLGIKTSLKILGISRFIDRMHFNKIGYYLVVYLPIYLFF